MISDIASVFSNLIIETTKIPGSFYTKIVHKCPDPPFPSSDTVIDRRVGGGAGLQDYTLYRSTQSSTHLDIHVHNLAHDTFLWCKLHPLI